MSSKKNKYNSNEKTKNNNYITHHNFIIYELQRTKENDEWRAASYQ